MARHTAHALAVAISRQFGREWRGSGLHRLLITHPRPQGMAAALRDPRPADPENGRRIAAGAFVLGGATLTPGPRGDPWDSPCPDRRFATALHRFGWLGDLTSLGDAGAAEGLRLTLGWRRVFGRWNGFSWSPEVLERRVFNLACQAHAITARASEAEAAQVTGDLARQARYLLALREGPVRAAERAAAAAVAGAALAGRAGDSLLVKALVQLDRTLPATVAPDGGHASRSPQAALELLLDLITLDDALTTAGAPAPDEVSQAIDRLCAAVRFFTLADGRLAAFQGGEALSGPYVAAARAQDELVERAVSTQRNGYHRLEARSLQVVADAAPPAAGAWSVAACAQPLAIEVLAGARRLIVGSGWSADAQAPQALRVVDAASTASLGEQACGEPMRGFPARVLGPRLVDAGAAVSAKRHEAPGALWLELSHDGWVRRFGLRHERRLYIDVDADELRGEDRVTCVTPPKGPDGRRFIPFVVRFHLHPEVSALIARDRKSVLLKAEGEEIGWWLRNDAVDVAIEPSAHYQDGQPRRSQQIVLRGQARADAGARLRWKLSAAGGRVDAESGPA
ncbi:heparinase II/III family protein [Phenylobacterium sp.]|uniref:heparinase II/III family protein n=1 Tax=Phenylobacterium sp. TaxID=1871053 RepID=UPI003982E67F